ncbi:hypothetical protein V8G54_002436 [Vigna mungo]|uniref:Uncharacterized protein n=1 Tax=Vigna mungo TaxID=3915 RepID=A0AAQ3PAD0_VIGMU
MSNETFCSTIKVVDIKVWIAIVVFQPIKKEGFLFEKWISHQQVYPISESWSANKTDLTKLKKDEWAKWYAVKINCMSESLKRFLGLRRMWIFVFDFNFVINVAYKILGALISVVQILLPIKYVLYQKKINNNPEIEDSDEESTEEDFRKTSE